MRMNYLHSGGHDTRVLGRFTEMEYLSRYGSSTTHNYTPHVPVSTTYNPTSYNRMYLNSFNLKKKTFYTICFKILFIYNFFSPVYPL